MTSRINYNVRTLFESWYEVEPDRILDCYPSPTLEQKGLESTILDFAYPCDFEQSTSVTEYSFVLTNIDAQWRFGFCRHDRNTKTAMIVLTFLPWHDQFFKFLSLLGELKFQKSHDLRSFISQVYAVGIPEAGSPLLLNPLGAGYKAVCFERPALLHKLPSIQENHNLRIYFNFAEPKFMIPLFAAMLAERRIIFTSESLDKISSCVQASNAFLYPMVWQHIFIPILPMKLKDTLGAPMPFVIGVHKSILDTMRREEIGEAVIFDCDRKTLETPFDDVKNMPHDIVSFLKKQLSASHSELQGDKLSKIFLNALVQLIGNYRDAFKYNDAKKVRFDEETFINSQPHQFKPFMKNMLQLQIFQQFIDERLRIIHSGEGCSDEFEMEIFQHSQRDNKSKGIRNVFKTNPALKQAVKSVKDGGKTIYKDMKTKLKESRSDIKSNVQNNVLNPPKVLDIRHSAPPSPTFDHVGQLSNANRPGQSSTMNKSDFHSFNTSYSPATSPSNSSSSSDMNILSELAGHNLFKKGLPVLNRRRNNGHPSSNVPQTKSNSGILADTSIPDQHLLMKNSSYSSILDSTPNIPPPLPPRPKTRPIHTKLLSQPVPSPILQQKASKSMCNGDTFIALSIVHDQSQAESIDLINLNDSSSLDVADFDPLNDNARNIPESLPRPSSNSIPTSVASFENPMYPYFKPSKKQELDTELLKIYGLDRFSVIGDEQKSMTSDILISKSNGKSSNSSKNWTQFE